MSEQARIPPPGPTTNLYPTSVSLGACHEGAAIESLCPSGLRLNDTATSYDTFYHNVTSYANSTANAIDTPGVINWHMVANGDEIYPSAMHFSWDLTSNLAIPIIFPSGSYSLISFDQDGYAYMLAQQNDMVSPPVYADIVVASWYVCLTRWSYLYHTLAWKVGRTGEPQNPSCVEVQVRRVFI
jgi:hypothetical protein